MARRQRCMQRTSHAGSALRHQPRCGASYAPQPPAGRPLHPTLAPCTCPPLHATQPCDFSKPEPRHAPACPSHCPGAWERRRCLLDPRPPDEATRARPPPRLLVHARSTPQARPCPLRPAPVRRPLAQLVEEVVLGEAVLELQEPAPLAAPPRRLPREPSQGTPVCMHLCACTPAMQPATRAASTQRCRLPATVCWHHPSPLPPPPTNLTLVA